MARMVCLANSQRPGGQCIAGIDLETKEWIRPTPRDGDAVPLFRTFVDGRLLEPLDVFDVELVKPKETPRFQRENQIIRNWNWRIVGRFRKPRLWDFVEESAPLFHGATDCLAPAVLESLPPAQWSSLQLVKPRKLRFEHDHRDQHRWRARFKDRAGNEYCLKLTDAIATRRLECGERISERSLLTVSLAKPWAPRDNSKPEMCYKLVATVIEL